ncbi:MULTISPECIES: hypothetical protein [unclassified Bradyrhizobium]
MSDDLINPTFKTLRRRTIELAATTSCNDPDADALILFYAAECGLKALYMSVNSLKLASDDNGARGSARSFGHRLDYLIAELKIAPKDLPSRPSTLKLKSGDAINVRHLHEAWRYGDKIQMHADVVTWLKCVLKFVRERL